MPNWPDARVRKFRQAAFVYLHVGLLYEAAVWAMREHEGMLPTRFGPLALWLVVGAAVTALVFAGLYWWQNAWVARGVWIIHAGRLPWAINGGLLADGGARFPPAFYVAALVVILVNLWMLARAGWDL